MDILQIKKIFFIGNNIMGHSVSKESVSVTNNAVSNAVLKASFNCKELIQANQTIKNGPCGCAQVGIPPGTHDCDDYLKEMLHAQEVACEAAQKDPTLSGAEVTCICKVPPAACNIDVSQESLLSGQMACQITSKQVSQIQNEFETAIGQELSKVSSGLGDIFNNDKNSEVAKVVNNIKNNITESVVENIGQSVKRNQTIVNNCGVNIGVTQDNYTQVVLNAMEQNSQFSSELNKLQNIVKQELSDEDSGFLPNFSHWFDDLAKILGPIGGVLLMIVLIGIVLIFAIVIIKKLKGHRQPQMEYAPGSYEMA